ncbi:MAG: XRE family transcriptional regulator [Gemmataceae bacterium]|nr:XRE family transcriptional regulator [Gemmataceae bacterium]
MQPETRKALEAAGWKFGDAADFLAMSDQERQMLDLRVDAALAVRRQREAMALSQQELARRIRTSQPRIVKIEKAAKDVTLDQILRAYAAAGGRIALREVAGAHNKMRSRRGKKASAGKQSKKVPVPSKVQIELVGRQR